VFFVVNGSLGTREERMDDTRSRRLGVVLYPGFELLDVFGPLEMFGNLPGAVEVVTVAERAGAVVSGQGPDVPAAYGFGDCPELDLLLVPGGPGTRTEVDNRALCEWLASRAPRAEVTMSVCTGSALLARAGLLNGRRATTNKMFFHWAAEHGPRVQWVREARWVVDGPFVTSSGVSAGMDMALAVIATLLGESVAEGLALATEYEWHRDPSWDPFAKAHGLV
jgi:transcriptional regulator GlxA family with amidase domain